MHVIELVKFNLLNLSIRSIISWGVAPSWLCVGCCAWRRRLRQQWARRRGFGVWLWNSALYGLTAKWSPSSLSNCLYTVHVAPHKAPPVHDHACFFTISLYIPVHVRPSAVSNLATGCVLVPELGLRFPMGDMSKLFVGQSGIHSTSLVGSHSLTAYAVWHGVTACCNA